MIDKVVLQYKILEHLGEGGMGVVYKAHDSKLDRLVALKFLPQGIIASEGDKARFLQEARVASAVTHSNVCVIHDIAEHEGQLFIVMEFVDGKTLRQITPVQKLQDAITYAIQIGEALHEAHGKGVVHRDIKADNIMVTARNQVKVMDFGLAKLKGSLKLTKGSSTVGTLAYMAPEQIQGGEVDARSDIFSFGVVFFEMLTGHLPFRGEHEAAMMYSILNEEPVPLSQYLPDVPSELLHIVGRALERDPADRYQTMSEILIDLNRIRRDTTKFSRLTPSAARRNGFPVKRGVLIVAALLVTILITGAAYLLFFRTSPTPSVRTLAVLPFRALTATSADADAMWSIGMTDAIISRLTPIRNLAVRPTSAVLRYAKAQVDPEQMARELAVESVLEGTYQRVGEVIRVSVQLVDCRTRSSRWSSHYDLRADDMLTFQDDMAQQVVQGLSVQLTSSEKEDLAVSMTKSKEAYALYLEASSYQFSTGPTQIENLHKRERLLQEALAIDPTFAQAYVMLGGTYAGIYWHEIPRGVVDRHETMERAKKAVDRALQINPRLADAYHTRGTIFWMEGKPVECIENLRKATELSPGLSSAWYIMGQQYHCCGLLTEAEVCFRRAAGLDRTNLITQWWHAQVVFFLGREAEAERELRRLVSQYPDDATMLSYLGEALRYQGRSQEAESLLARAAMNWWPAAAPNPAWYDAIYFAGYLYASQGRRERIDGRLLQLKETDVNDCVLAYRLASLYALLDEKQSALGWLRRAVDLGYHNYHWYMRDKNLDKLRSDPGFQNILTEVRTRWESYKQLLDV